MSRTSGEELKQDVVRSKSEQYDELREQFVNDEISEEEFSRRADELLDNGDDFLEYEESASDKAKDAGRSFKETLAYYSLPICLLLPFLFVVLVPNISAMIAVTAAPALIGVGLVLWGSLKIGGYV